MDTKKCTTCGETYIASTEFFYKDSRKGNGLRASCKWCSDIHRVSKHKDTPNDHPANYLVNGVQCQAFKAVAKPSYTEHKTTRGTRIIEFKGPRKSPDAPRKQRGLVGYTCPLASAGL